MLMLPVVTGQLIQPAKPDAARRCLHISIGGVPDSEKARITGIYPVDLDGFLTMWKVGKIDTMVEKPDAKAGKKKKTYDELAKTIEAAYVKAGIYERPAITVKSAPPSCGIGPPAITLVGQVKTVGRYHWHEGETLGNAVKAAGGPTAYGSVRRVKLYQNGKVYTYNLEREKQCEVNIYPTDLIEVPQKSIFWKPTKK